MRDSPWHQTPWDWRASVQFICGGTGTGLLLFTTLAALADGVWLLRTGLLALAFVSLGLFMVWIKLGRRWRMLFVFLNPRTSWMTREAFLSLPVLGFGLLGIWLRSTALVGVAALIGMGFLYAQARILRAARGIPAWRAPLAVPLIVVTGLTEGAALLTFATLPFGAVGAWLPATLLVLVALRLWIWTIYQQALSAPGAAPAGTLAELARVRRGIVVSGHLMPLAALVIALVIPNAVALAWLAGLGALGMGWRLKYTLIARAAYNQGFAIEHTPARTPGFAGPHVKPGWN